MPTHHAIHNGTAARAALALVAALFGAAPARAFECEKMFALQVIVEAPDSRHAQSFGALGDFMQSLRRAGHICRLDHYEHGVDIDCGDPKAPDVLVNFAYAPSRCPGFALVDSLRARGKNGGELPTAERAQFLSDFARIVAKTTPY